jgi:zinc transporter ZupT
VQVIDDARLQALAAADPLDGKAAAMVLEAAARASGDLIIASATSLSASRSKEDKWVRAKLAGYRGALLCGLWALGLVLHRRIAHGLATLFSSASDAQTYRRLAVGVFVALLAFTISESVGAVFEAYGRKRPAWVTAVVIVGTTAAGIVGAIIG